MDLCGRLLRLKDVALGGPDSQQSPRDSALLSATYDCAVDALVAVFEECKRSTSLSKDKNVARFLNKCEHGGRERRELGMGKERGKGKD